LPLTVQDLAGFKGIITSLNVTPDGRYLIVGTGNNRINLFNVDQQTLVYSQISEVNDFSHIALSQDGKLMAIAAGKNVDIRRVANGARLKSLRGHTQKVSGMAFSPDGKTLVSVSGGDRTIRVWDVEAGQLLATLAENLGPTTSVVFTPDGRQFITGAIGGDRTLKFWQAKTFELLKTTPQQPGFINGLAVTPNNLNLVAAVRNFIKIWDLTSGQDLHFTKGPSLEINTIAVSPDSQLVATANKEGNIMLFEIATGKLLTTLNGHKGWVLSLAFSPNGDILYSGAEDKTVKIWRVKEQN
jgi:WD40 repeat protein